MLAMLRLTMIFRVLVYNSSFSLDLSDVASAVLMVLSLPARARVPELSIIPTQQSFV